MAENKRLFDKLDSVVEFIIERENNLCPKHHKDKLSPEKIEMFKKIIEDDNGVIFLFEFTAYMTMYDYRASKGFERSLESIRDSARADDMLKKS